MGRNLSTSISCLPYQNKRNCNILKVISKYRFLGIRSKSEYNVQISLVGPPPSRDFGNFSTSIGHNFGCHRSRDRPLSCCSCPQFGFPHGKRSCTWPSVLGFQIFSSRCDSLSKLLVKMLVVHQLISTAHVRNKPNADRILRRESCFIAAQNSQLRGRN